MSWLAKIIVMTNATKLQIVTFINAIMGVLIAFDVLLTQAQLGAIDIAVNAALALIGALTFTNSAKRIDNVP